MKAGDRIRLDVGWAGMYTDLQDFTVEEFRHCLGIFLTDEARAAGAFSPLCNLYGNGPDSQDGYISNYGPYRTNQVPIFMNLPRLDKD